MEENLDGYSSNEQLGTQISYNEEGTLFDSALSNFGGKGSIDVSLTTDNYSLTNTSEISTENVNNIVVGSFGTGFNASSKNYTSTAGLGTLSNSSNTLVALNNKTDNKWADATLSVLADCKDSNINNLTVDAFSNATSRYLQTASYVAKQINNDTENNYAHPDKITFLVGGTGNYFATGNNNNSDLKIDTTQDNSNATAPTKYVTQADIDALKETNSQFLFVSKTGDYTGEIGTDGNPKKIKDNAGELKAESLLDDDNLGSTFKLLKENDIPAYIAGVNIEAFNEIHPGTGQGEHPITDYVSQAYILNLQNNPELVNDAEFMENFKKIVDVTEVVSETYINEETGEEETRVKQIHSIDAYLDLFDFSGHNEYAYTGNIIGVDNTLSSDLYNISYSMGEAANSIDADYSLTYDRGSDTNLLGETTTSVPACLVDINESLFSANANLSSKLGEDLKLIASAALTIYNMDSNMAQEAQNLSDLSGSAGYDAEVIGNFVSQLGDSEDYTKGLVDNLRKFDTGLFNSNIEQVRANGKGILAGKIDLQSLGDLIGPNGSLMNELDSDIASANSELSGIYDCQGVLGLYEGEIWDIAGEKLGGYEEAMLLRKNIDLKLKDAYAAAYKMIADYMDPYDILDDSQIEELETEIQNLENQIASTQASLDAKQWVPHTRVSLFGKSYSVFYTLEYVIQGSMRVELQHNLLKYKAELKECQQLLAKLKGLKDVMEKAEKLIEDAVSGIIAEYDAQVSNITVGQSVDAIK